MSSARPIHIFSGMVHKIDINPYMEVPDRIIQKLQQDAKIVKGPIPVAGRLRDKLFSTTVVRFRGMWRLYLNLPMRRDANVEVGDKVNVSIWFDKAPRTVPAPRKFKMALSKNKGARETFQRLAPSRQKEILRYLNNLKQPAVLERNIEKVIRSLVDRKVR